MTENLILVNSMDKLKRMNDMLLEHAERGGKVGFDVETGYSGPDRKKGSLDVAWDKQFVCGLSLSPGKKFGAYVPLLHDNSMNLDPELVWPLLQPLLESAPIVAHNKKFEIANCLALERKGHGPRIVVNAVYDTMLDAYVLSEWRSVGLKEMVLDELDHQMAHIEELFPGATKKERDALRFNVLELTPEVVNYAAEDSLWCVRLSDKISDRAKAERSRMYRIEHGIAEQMAAVEARGVQIDYELLSEHAARADAFCAQMEQNLRAAFGKWAGTDQSKLKFNSPMQLQKLLYRDLGVKTTRLTAGAQKNPEKYAEKEPWQKLSTDDVALEAASHKYPEVQMLLELRQAWNLAKRLHSWKEEYCDYYPDHRVHAQYGQVIVGTGRFAANYPPIQQCPKEWRFVSSPVEFNVWDKDESAWREFVAAHSNGVEFWTGNFRDVITSGPGTYFLTYDYSQIELRVMAGVSRESSLLEAFERGDDVHSLTAAMMLGKAVEDLAKEERQVGKTMNFGLLYQMQAKSLAERLGVSFEQGKVLFAAYFSSFTSITNWMDKAKSEGKSKGYIETPFGRKWKIWELESSNRAIWAKGERMLVNAPIQGGAADYMKIAMLRAEKALKEKGWWDGDVMTVMNQHDALTFEVSNSLHPEEVRAVLQEAVVFRVPGFPKIVADWELGQRWGSSTPWKGGMYPVWDGEVWGLSKDENDERRVAAPEYVVVKEEKVEEAPKIVMPPARPSEDGLKLRLHLQVMPTSDQFERLMALVTRNAGKNSVTVVTPEGELDLEYGTCLTPADQGKVSMAVPGALLVIAPESVANDVLMAGLSL